MLHALSQSRPGPYQIQAAISALHCEAENWAATDWPQILGLYSALYQLAPTPVVALNHAVALAHSGDTRAAMLALNPLETELAEYQPFYAARAELLAKAGKPADAYQDYARAIKLATAPEAQAFLRQKQQELP